MYNARSRSESIKFDSIKLNTTLPNLQLKQSKIRLRFDICFTRRILGVLNIIRQLKKLSLSSETPAMFKSRKLSFEIKNKQLQSNLH